jgi:hypothetical protein
MGKKIRIHDEGSPIYWTPATNEIFSNILGGSIIIRNGQYPLGYNPYPITVSYRNRRSASSILSSIVDPSSNSSEIPQHDAESNQVTRPCPDEIKSLIEAIQSLIELMKSYFEKRQSDNNPVMVLKVRLAKGELSKEEYEETRKIIES